MLFLRVHRFFDYAGPASHSRNATSRVAFPVTSEGRRPDYGFSKLNRQAHRYLYLRFERHLTMSPARLEARMDSPLSFPVGLFHPLQHAGLYRRSTYNAKPEIEDSDSLGIHLPGLPTRPKFHFLKTRKRGEIREMSGFRQLSYWVHFSAVRPQADRRHVAAGQ
jgi:hypothetical protein